MVVRPFPKTNDVNCVWVKAESPIEVTELGIVKDVNPIAPLNAAAPIVVTLEGIVIAEITDPENDELAIVVTLEGIV